MLYNYKTTSLDKCLPSMCMVVKKVDIKVIMRMQTEYNDEVGDYLINVCTDHIFNVFDNTLRLSL